MIMGDFSGVIPFLMACGAVVVGLIWGGYELFNDDSIRSSEPITPRLEIVVHDNVVDTVYVYERP